MDLLYKPDFDEARGRLEALWQHQIIDRPCLAITAPKEGFARSRPRHRVRLGWEADYPAALQAFEENFAASTFFAAEALPSLQFTYGPDQFAAFLGLELEFAEAEPDVVPTSWAKAIVKRWEDVLPFHLDPDNRYWMRTLEFLRLAREAAKGKYLVEMMDLHSNMDTLLAFRGGEDLCMDLLDQPEMVEQALADVRHLYVPIYNGIYEAAGLAETGCTGWLPFYSAKRFATIQSDFIAMISPRQFDRFVNEALREEAGFLDHCVFHWDGPTALPHFEAITSIAAIGAVQWVPGASQKPHIAWIDLLKRLQQAGKIVYVAGTPEEVKVIHKELDPTRALYVTSCASQKDAETLVKWFKDNT